MDYNLCMFSFFSSSLPPLSMSTLTHCPFQAVLTKLCGCDKQLQSLCMELSHLQVEKVSSVFANVLWKDSYDLESNESGGWVCSVCRTIFRLLLKWATYSGTNADTQRHKWPRRPHYRRSWSISEPEYVMCQRYIYKYPHYAKCSDTITVMAKLCVSWLYSVCITGHGLCVVLVWENGIGAGRVSLSASACMPLWHASGTETSGWIWFI